MTPTHAIATLILGFVAGYLGQRSRLCFVSGYRDVVLTRDTTLLRGVLAAFGGALLGYVAFGRLGGFLPGFPMLHESIADQALPWVFAVVGGLGLGAVGMLAGGCPFRMHVLASEGRQGALFYLVGFYIGMVFFNIVLTPVFMRLGLPL
ncbi:MAG: YeeE/YedE thiosulfate transporter family protein [Coriobacteriales bacterium]|nr:YeeE/YedE family protein [Actinomycetes bacterium]